LCSAASLRGNLFVDLGVARLVTCLDDENIVPFFVCGGLAKAILQRGAKWHAKLRSESKRGVRHCKRWAGQLAARSARQMEDLMKKADSLVVTYRQANRLARVVVGRILDWKQNVNLGAKQNPNLHVHPACNVARRAAHEVRPRRD
jgi:transposase